MFLRTVINTVRLWKPKLIQSLPLDCMSVFYRQQYLTFHIINLSYSSSKPTKEDKDLHNNRDEIIKLLSFRSSKDALPFYNLPVKTLQHIYKVTKNDQANGFCDNRLYYLAEKINCKTYVISEKLARRTFVYGLSFNWLSNSLEVLIEYGVSGDRIVRDLWVLKYHSDTIRERLERFKSMGVEIMYPWMVRCSEEILNRYIEQSQETKNILGETKTTQIYLANRLNISAETVDKLCVRIPSLKTIRVTKVKHFLDFLIDEGFKVEDIAARPRVLTSSPKTVQKRINQLRNLGLSEINLNVLCRSQKDFKKYVNSVSSAVEDSKNCVS